MYVSQLQHKLSNLLLLKEWYMDLETQHHRGAC